MTDGYNPPAFPVGDRQDYAGDLIKGWRGMTLRDWFAGQAMVAAHSDKRVMDFLADGDSGGMYRRIAERSYELADVMLAERAKEPQQ